MKNSVEEVLASLINIFLRGLYRESCTHAIAKQGNTKRTTSVVDPRLRLSGRTALCLMDGKRLGWKILKQVQEFPNLMTGKQKGFTLIELLVVVLIIGILAAVALPQYQLAVDKAHFSEYITVGRSLAQALELYYMSNGKYPDYWAELDVDIPGCTETSSARFDLNCTNFAADLNYNNFFIWEGKRGGNHSFPQVTTGCLIYYFNNGSLGKFKCDNYSGTERGKKLCNSLCGAEDCYLN